jgi:hypothetical protein
VLWFRTRELPNNPADFEAFESLKMRAAPLQNKKEIPQYK